MTTAEADAMEFESANQDLTVTTAQPVVATELEVIDATWGGLVPGGDTSVSDELKGKNKCTYDKQMVCDGCISNCDSLCAQPGGGGPSGTCVGAFCPTKCGQCQLSCFSSCGKCIPTIFK